jgi:large subunit ribosomal protein L30e
MPLSVPDLERQLKSVTKTGKYVVGRKEVLGSLKGSKLVVWSASANVPPQILSECKTLQVPAIRFDGNPIELGKVCGIPYKVSVIAVKSPGDAVLSTFENSKDYTDQTSMFQGTPVVRQEPEEPTSDVSEKKKQKEKAKEEKEKSGKATKEKGTTKAKRSTGKKASDDEEGTEGKTKKKESKSAKKSAKKTTAKKSNKKKDDAVEEAESEAAAEEDTDEEDED